MDDRLVGLVIGGGNESGFKSKIPRILHPLLGTPLVRLAVEAVRDVRPAKLVVSSGLPPERAAAELAGLPVTIVGPGKGREILDAVSAGRREWAADPGADVLAVPADIPLVPSAVLRALVSRHRRKGCAATMLWMDDPAFADGADARRTPTGVFVFQAGDLARVLPGVLKSARKGASDLTAAYERLAAGGRPVGGVPAPEAGDLLRVATRHDLALAGGRLRDRKMRALAAAGVTVLDPASTWIDWTVTIGPDTVVYPGTVIEGPTAIGRDCRIYPHAHIIRSVLGDDVHVFASSVIDEAVLESDVRIGPFARIRMQTRLRTRSRVGNFVEMKKTDFGSGSKAMHLSYLGDSEVGPAANIGAGTITCNYDGARKNPTVIGAGAFIGSGTELVAPVRIGRGAYVAAGSVITKNVADDALAVARGRQIEKPGWAAARRAKIQAEKNGRSSR